MQSFCEAFQPSSGLASTIIICLTFCSGIICKDSGKTMWFLIDLALNNLFRHFAAVAFLSKAENTRSLGILLVKKPAKSSFLNKCSYVAQTGASVSWPKPYLHPHGSNINFWCSLTHGLQKKVICFWCWRFDRYMLIHNLVLRQGAHFSFPQILKKLWKYLK